jgi:hypothetical protein
MSILYYQDIIDHKDIRILEPRELEITRRSTGHIISIPIYYHFPFGTGNAINEDSALVRPFNVLIQRGKLA